MAGFEGRMLEVNLADGKVGRSTVDKDVLRKYIGGSGLAARLMFERVRPDVDPLSPDNILFVMTGPTSGTNLPGGSRLAVCAKSPLTNMWGESNCGGSFAAELRSAGWDGIVVQGASSRPVYILIEDDKAEVKDASDLWGKNNFEVTSILKKRHGGQRTGVLVIGQGGEKLVKYAAICNEDRDFAARCGLGTVMGSKKLKGIVVKGSGKVPLAEPTRFANRRKVVVQKAKENVATMVLGQMGTSAAVDVSMVTGDLPGKNWTVGDNTAVASKIGGAVLNSPTYLTGNKSCRGCMVGCKRVVRIPEGPYAGMKGPGPEYEGVVSLGSLLMIDDMAAVIKLNELCNDYGIDVISFGGTVAMVMDCFENGILSAKDADGLELKWGNADAVMKLVPKVARREGFGDVLAEGAKRAAERIGKNASDYAVVVKGMEVPMHDPRANHGLGLSYATGVRGACHTNDIIYSIGVGIVNWPEFNLAPGVATMQSQGMAEIVKNSQDLGQVYGSAIICYMTISVMDGEDLIDIMQSASGFDYTMEELKECAERIWLLKRGISNLMGITAADDTLPKQILTPTKEGGAAGSAPDLQLMLREFYPLRGLGPDGRPTKEALERVGLSDLAARLY